MTGSEALKALEVIGNQIGALQSVGERIENSASMALALHTALKAMKNARGGDLRPETRRLITSAIRMAEAELGLEAA